MTGSASQEQYKTDLYLPELHKLRSQPAVRKFAIFFGYKSGIPIFAEKIVPHFNILQPNSFNAC